MSIICKKYSFNALRTIKHSNSAPESRADSPTDQRTLSRTHYALSDFSTNQSSICKTNTSAHFTTKHQATNIEAHIGTDGGADELTFRWADCSSQQGSHFAAEYQTNKRSRSELGFCL